MCIRDRRYHCFGCGADGDVIDFAAALYGLGKKEAAVQLAQDFGLSYEDWKPPGKVKKPKPRQKSQEEQFQEAKSRCFRTLADYLHLLMAWRMDYAPHSPEEAFHPRFVEALQKPVSYTHLDVYKRQTYHYNRNGSFTAPLSATFGTKPRRKKRTSRRCLK